MKYFSLFPVLRGEGRGEGLGAGGREKQLLLERLETSAHHDATRRSPLSPTLSPEYREVGVRGRARPRLADRAAESAHGSARDAPAEARVRSGCAARRARAISSSYRA